MTAREGHFRPEPVPIEWDLASNLAAMLSTVRACFALLPRRLQLAWLGLVPLLAAGALVELAAAAALYAILARVVAPGTIRPSLPFGAALGGSGGGGLVAAALGLGALFLLKNLWLAGVHTAQTWLLGSSMSAAFRRLTGAWLAAPFAQVARGRSADLIHDATEGLGVAFRSVMSAAAAVLAHVLLILPIRALLASTAPRPVLA